MDSIHDHDEDTLLKINQIPFSYHPDINMKHVSYYVITCIVCLIIYLIGLGVGIYDLHIVCDKKFEPVSLVAWLISISAMSASIVLMILAGLAIVFYCTSQDNMPTSFHSIIVSCSIVLGVYSFLASIIGIMAIVHNYDTCKTNAISIILVVLVIICNWVVVLCLAIQLRQKLF